ncbi:pyridoxal-dependent decarboxylase, exosortase A system-associated [Methylomagnum ishizawai]|uniref:pyridoxal-dependent decarboxylase, exosortase A system-associated n=1 Tax=Methylomagnum ishizawai TaxID=1760988 RepID=UPI001C3407A9|nr:pyridoxal-dependent decarboxylase, exosortase A system-associated [Methylomagnum ishizawai]BBL75331.1 pyridoxal-dependent decarboxylase, exosortase A system-associated [Methylomagnum ishizawai]
MNEAIRYTHPILFPVRDNCLTLGGTPLSRLVERVGYTPFYAYDRGLITQRVGELRAALPADIHLHYAIKANPMPAVVQHLAGLIDGFDVASAGEMKTALDTPMAPDKISFAGPGKTERELWQATAAGIVINLESGRELDILAHAGRELGLRPKVAVRVNPDFELKSSGMKMGGGPKPFGVDAERVPELLARMAGLPVDFYGFHIFSGSQNLKAESIMEAQRNTLELARRLAASAPGPVRLLNLGGGFGIPYFPGEKPLDLGAVGGYLASLMPAARRDFPKAEFVIELGRYLVGEAGVYVARVLDRKESRGQVFLVVDGGLHHHLSASGNFGQVIRKNYPVLVGNRVAAVAAGSASVVGPLCTPLDLLADRMPLGHANVGDLVVILQSGAYGFTSSPMAFLGHPPALEVLV